jgi:hypothetical protein
VEIKCQLDATDKFLLQILLLAQHVSGTIMAIIRSSRVLYKWLSPVVFGVARKPGTQPSAPHYTDNLKTTHQIRQAATTCIIFSSSWGWADWCPKHVEQAIRSAIKIHLLHLVGILFPHIIDDARSKRHQVLIFITVYMVVFLFNTLIYVFLLLCICILIV